MSRKPSLAATAILLLFPLPSSADIVTVTVTGTVAPVIWDGSTFVVAPLIDHTGIFGPGGASLTGDAFMAVWTMNTNCACNFITSDEVAGGSFYGSESPVLSSILTIQGHSVNFGPGIYGVMQVYNNGPNHAPGYGSGTYQNVTVDPLAHIAMNTFVDSDTLAFSGFLNQPFSYVVNPLTDNTVHPFGIGGSFELGSLQGYFNVNTITLSNPTFAVPAPVLGAGMPGAILVWGAFLGWVRWRKAQPSTASEVRADLIPTR
jgi:hypothetical protein